MIRTILNGMRGVSTLIADTAARPAAQLVVLVGGTAWLADGGDMGRLASAASIASLILTQMVLYQQRKRETALQLKIDELILAMAGARDEVVGIEYRTEEEIEDIRAGRDGHSPG